ncbi:MAG: hypothetical protein ACQGVK_07930 [Myxococcota bacterium]
MSPPRLARYLLPLGLSLPLATQLACSPGGEPRSPDPITGSVSGTYAVEGVTTPVGADRGRPIEGTLILVEQGDGSYSSTFHLRSSYPGPDGNVETEVIGKGQGMVDGRSLVGTAETQILTAAFPGVDAKFPFLPRQYGPRVVSTTLAEFAPTGGVSIEIETHAAEGQDYIPTRTTLTGARARPTGVAGFPPVGAERMARGDAESAP